MNTGLRGKKSIRGDRKIRDSFLKPPTEDGKRKK